MSTTSRSTLALAAMASTLAATALSSAAHVAAAGAAPAPAPVTSRHTLITGERVLETQDARGHVRFSVADTGAHPAPVFTYQLGTARYVVDAYALPFIGSELDPSLFDSAPTTAETSGGVAVTVTWHGTTAPAMPWLTSPHPVTTGVTGGLITAASGALLRADLAAEPASSRGAWTGALGGIDRITRTGGVTAPTRQSPFFVQYTLTVNGINLAGHPDSGDVLNILNTDNAAKFINFAFWNLGVIKLSVPVGHYSLMGQFTNFAPSGAITLSEVIMDITVKGNTTVTMEARTATARVSVVTPLPASSGSGSTIWQRLDATGFGGIAAGVSWPIAGGGQPPFRVFVSPTPAPKVGTQGWVVSFHLDSAPAVPSPYSFDVTFGSIGSIAATQRHRVAFSQLGAIVTRYYSDVAGRLTAEGRSGIFPWQVFSSGFFDTFAAPAGRTEYVTAGPELVWTQTLIADLNDFTGFFIDSNRVFQVRERATEDWGRAPIGPGVQVDTGGTAGLQVCPVCFENNTLEFVIYPFGDNPPGHVGFPNTGAPGVTETDTATLSRNGVVIASGSDPQGPIAVPPGPARYALHYDVAMSAPWWTLSTSTSTTWTFSIPQSLAGTPPSGWECFSGSTFGCSVVGLMVPDFALPVDLLNQMSSGPVNFHLGIEHILGAAIAAKQATVSVSFNGGATWHAAQVSAAAGGFNVAYLNPGSGTASLRIHVTDANGGVLDQTIINAYAVS